MNTKYTKGCFLINDKEMQINQAVVEKQIRVIDEDGKQLGIMTSVEALKLAESKNLDLVKIAPMAVPPVCKIMNYGKFKFDQSKRIKETKKNQKTVSIKEVRVSLNINSHDLDTKIKNAIKFLSAGNKVRVCVKFKGREMLRVDSGHALIEKFKQVCSAYGTIDKAEKLEGRNMTAIIIPKKTSAAKSNDAQDLTNLKT